MEAVVCMKEYLLLILVAGVHLSSEPDIVFGLDGGRAELRLHSFPVDYAALYRVTADGGLLQLNCSESKWPQPECHIWCRSTQSNVYQFSVCIFTIKPLTMSHSGDYIAEGWKGGNLTKRQSFQLIVCAGGSGRASEENVVFDNTAVLCKLDTALEPGSSLQLYQTTVPLLARVHSTEDLGSNIINKTLVLNTNLSLKPLVEDLKGRLQVDLKDSLVTLSGNRGTDSGDWYCTLWRGAQCQTYRHSILIRKPKNVFAYEQENLTLHCVSKFKFPREVLWFTPKGDIQVSDNQTRRQEVMMYMPNGSETGNYSLIIPSVSMQHSGLYTCMCIYQIQVVTLYVCAKSSTLIVRFSQGESVLLNVTEHRNESWFAKGMQWYRRKVLEPQVLILDTGNKSVLVPEDLRGRVTVTHYSLLLSNLTAEDSGVYTSRVFGEVKREGKSYESCFEGAIRLLHRDPFGVDSPFYRAYASLIGCVLMGLLAAVVWFSLSNRTREQTSGHQSGDEDIYDNVEVAEDSV